MLPTTSSKITLHCSASKGNFSFKACSVQLHCSKTGLKKFTQPTSYLSVLFLLEFNGNHALDLPFTEGQKTMWLTVGNSQFVLPPMIWRLGGTSQTHKMVRGIFTSGFQINLRIDFSVHLASNGGLAAPFVLDGTPIIKGMNVEFRDSFKRRVTGRLPSTVERKTLQSKDLSYALL
jgi:hypothetical protein